MTPCRGARGPVRWTALLATVALAVPVAGFESSVSAATNAAGGNAAGGAVTTFPVHTFPNDITSGPDGAVWFTNSGTEADGGRGSISRITTAGIITTFTDSTMRSPFRITAGPDGALWFTNASGNSIGRITTTGVVTSFTDPTISRPLGITAGPDGALWFTNEGDLNSGDRGSIGRITTAGVVTSFTDPTIDVPAAITPGADGALWFNNLGTTMTGSIGRITTAGVVTNFVSPDINYPGALTTGPDGAVWFTNDRLNNYSIGRITTTGAVTKYTNAVINFPSSITAGSDGALWFANTHGRSIGRISPTGGITHTTDPSIANPQRVTAGPDGALWFTNFGVGDASIGRIASGLTPRVPRKPSAGSGDARASLDWTVPVSSGGSPITAYAVTTYVGTTARTSQLFNSSATEASVTGLTNGRTYRFKIAAQSAKGLGAWSDFTNAVTVGTPLDPTGVTGTKLGPGVLRVAFKGPATNGAPITKYTASCISSRSGSKTATGKASPITVSGLSPAKWACTISATNSRGTGLPSLPSAPVHI